MLSHCFPNSSSILLCECVYLRIRAFAMVYVLNFRRIAIRTHNLCDSLAWVFNTMITHALSSPFQKGLGRVSVCVNF